MATHTMLSPSTLSPRKPLQALSTNVSNTPNLASNKVLQHASPFKPTVSLTPTTLLSLKEQYHADSYILNVSRKRSFNEAIAVEERDSSQTRASFSSLINYDPPTTSPKQSDQSETCTTPQMTAEINSIKIRADTLKLRLQMAMFRVQTNQLNIPLSSLQVPTPLQPSPLSRLSPASLPSTPRQKRLRAASNASSTDEDLPQARNDYSTEKPSGEGRCDEDLTSSAVKGHAVGGLLELRRSG